MATVWQIAMGCSGLAAWAPGWDWESGSLLALGSKSERGLTAWERRM